MNKRGYGQQFNWILVLVGGAIILIFFIAFAFQYQKLAEKREDAKVTIELDNAFANLLTIEAFADIDLPYLSPLYLNCNSITIGEFKRDIKDKIIFSPNKIVSKKFKAWITSWKLPYKVDNFIYISYPKYKYYLVYDSSSKKFVENLIENIPKEDDEIIFDIKATDISKIDSIKDETDVNDKVKIILFTDKLELVIFIKELEIDADVVLIEPNKKQGLIKYEEGDTYYIGEELIYGAIFSDYENYKCNLNKSVNKLNLISDLYSKKASHLFYKNSNCPYTLTKLDLDKIKSLKLEDIYPSSERLKLQNEKLDEAGCKDVF